MTSVMSVIFLFYVRYNMREIQLEMLDIMYSHKRRNKVGIVRNKFRIGELKSEFVRYIVTTMRNKVAMEKLELPDLYSQLWEIESQLGEIHNCEK